MVQQMQILKGKSAAVYLVIPRHVATIPHAHRLKLWVLMHLPTFYVLDKSRETIKRLGRITWFYVRFPLPPLPNIITSACLPSMQPVFFFLRMGRGGWKYEGGRNVFACNQSAICGCSFG